MTKKREKAVPRRPSPKGTAAKRRATTKSAAKKPGSKKAALSAANRRTPLREVAALEKGTRAQLALILKEEGAGTVAAAAKDPEWRDSVEVVDVCGPDGAPRYQLWTWPSGSAALFVAGTTRQVGSATQHTLTLEGIEAAERAAFGPLLGALRKAGSGPLKLSTEAAPAVAASSAGPRGTRGDTDPLDTVKAQLAQLDALPKHGARISMAQRLTTELFGPPWRPYPKLRPTALTGAQRALLEGLLKRGLASDTQHVGLPQRDDELERFLALTPAGPADVEIEHQGQRSPLWCAVSDVGSGHLEPAPVLDAFGTLPSAVALAAWRELARGEAYDINRVHPRNMAEAGMSRTPANVKHRTRLFGWLADACVRLGEPGRAAAEKLAGSLPKWDWGHPAFVALLSLCRHAQARGESLPAKHNSLLNRLRGPEANVFAEPVLNEIAKGIPSA